MTVGWELACWAGCRTLDANATKNKEECLPAYISSEPLALKNFRIHQDYFGQCTLGSGLWAGRVLSCGRAKEFNEVRVRLVGSRVGQKSASDTNFLGPTGSSQLLVVAVLVQVTLTPDMVEAYCRILGN